jgi:hypothetical protein
MLRCRRYRHLRKSNFYKTHRCHITGYCAGIPALDSSYLEQSSRNFNSKWEFLFPRCKITTRDYALERLSPTDMNTGMFLGLRTMGPQGSQPQHKSVNRISRKYGNLEVSEDYGPLRALIAITFPVCLKR